MNVSIVIPTLNEEQFIEDCLDSVHRNINHVTDNVDVEVIIVDSHSTDNTIPLVRAHRVDCRIVAAEEGILNAREMGVDAADGELIVSLDADSVYDDQYLTALVTPFMERKDVVLTYGPCYGEQPLHVDASIRVALQFGLPLVGLYWVSGANRAFKKSVFRAVDGYNRSKDSRSIFHVMVEEQVRLPVKMEDKGEIIFVTAATAVQSSRTLKQLLLIDKKNGGRDWAILQHYRLLDRFKELGQRIINL